MRSSRPANSMSMDEGQLECDYFQRDCAVERDCRTSHKCSGSGRESVPACVAVWRNSTENGIEVLYKHCMLVQHRPPYSDLSCGHDECIASAPTAERNSSAFFSCCCYKPHCNRQVRYTPVVSNGSAPVASVKNSSRGVRTVPHTNDNEFTIGLSYALLPICLLTLLVVFAYWMYRRNRLRRLRQQLGIGYNGQMDISPFVHLKALPSAGVLADSIQLNEIVSKGRYGSVWKARLCQEQTVAVKVFPHGEAESWIREQQIYATPGLRDHPNILYFIAANVRGIGTQAEYWLITAYHERGSLHDVLKRETLLLTDALRLAISTLCGLAFLHEEDVEKPTIAHRDLKSKNVLVKSDMTVCIADFGMAIKCSNGHLYDDIHTQVGTSRYMAPEVLQGATEFSAPAFRRIDVYACALVLWEIILRTHFTEDVVDQYRLPFEEFVSAKLKVQDALRKLQDVVVVQKQRPVLKDSWRENAEGKLICATLEEMWDTEAEARLTAGCALARFLSLQSTIQSSTGPAKEIAVASDTTPLISDYNSNITAPMTNGSVHQTASNIDCS